MKSSRCACLALIAVLMVVTTEAFPVTQQHGAFGKITRMIVNHNANNDEIFIMTTIRRLHVRRWSCVPECVNENETPGFVN